MKEITFSQREQIVGGNCPKVAGYAIAALIGMGSYVASELICEESNVTPEKLIISALIGVGYAYGLYARV